MRRNEFSLFTVSSIRFVSAFETTCAFVVFITIDTNSQSNMLHSTKKKNKKNKKNTSQFVIFDIVFGVDMFHLH